VGRGEGERGTCESKLPLDLFTFRASKGPTREYAIGRREPTYAGESRKNGLNVKARSLNPDWREGSNSGGSLTGNGERERTRIIEMTTGKEKRKD